MIIRFLVLLFFFLEFQFWACAYDEILLISPNYTNIVYQQSYDMPIDTEQLRPRYHGCVWNGTGFGFGNATTGAFVSDGSCAIMLSNFPRLPTDLSIQMQIAVDSVPSESSVLFALGNPTEPAESSIEIGISGHGNIRPYANNSDFFREAALQIRVYNKGKSCGDLGIGCPLDLPGFFQIGTFMDLLISFSQNGFTSVYVNGSLVKSDYLFKRNPDLNYRAWGFIGASMETGQKLHSSFGKRKAANFTDNAAFRLRSFTITNSTYSPFNISDFYYSNIAILPTPTTQAQYLMQPDGSVVGSISKAARFNFYSSTTSDSKLRRINFADRTTFDPEPLTNTAQAVAVGSVQRLVRDALGTPNFNGVVLTNSTSYLSIAPILFSPHFSIQAIFKMNPLKQSRVIFGCSAGGSDSGGSGTVDGIYLIASPLNEDHYKITLAFQRGRQYWFEYSCTTDSVLSSIIAHRIASNISNILVTMDDEQIQIFHHGILIGKFLDPPTVYPRWRNHCTLGGFGKYTPARFYSDNGLFKNTRGATSDSFSIGYRFFSYWPFVLSANSIGSVRVTNSSVSIISSWDPIIFDFTAKPNDLYSDYIGRGGAEWSGTINSLSIFQNGTTLRPGWILKNGGYLNLGSLDFGDDLSMLFEFSLFELKEGSILCQFTNGPVYPGADEFTISTGAVDSISADLVVNVKNNGQENPNGPIRLEGVLRSFLTHALIIVFRMNKINIYLDGVPLVKNGLLWSPAPVQRPFAFIGQSIVLDNRTSSMAVYSLRLLRNVWTADDLASMFSFNVSTYKFSFLNEFQRNIEGDIAEFPKLRNCSFSTNPFNLRLAQYDGTLKSGLFPTPTPGVYLNNKSPKRLESEYHLYLDRWHKYETVTNQISDLTSQLASVNSSLTFYQMNFSMANSLILDLSRTNSESTLESESINNNSTNATSTKLTPLQQLLGEIGEIKNNTVDLLLKRDELVRLITKLENDQKLYISEFQSLSQPLSMDEFVGVPVSSFIEAGPTLMGGSAITIRTKVRVKSVDDVAKWMPIWEFSNGPANDTISLSISGNTTNHILQLVVYRGGRWKSVVSGAMDGSFYWLDVIITITDDIVKFYNWGNFVSSAKGMWTPTLIPRSGGTIGMSISPPSFLVDSAISLVVFWNQAMDPASIREFYLTDHPQIAIASVAQMWQVTQPILPNDTNKVVRHMWLLDFQTKENLFNNLYGRNCKWNDCVDCPTECYDHPELFAKFIHAGLDQDRSSMRKNTLNPLFKTKRTKKNFASLIDEEVPRRVTSSSNLFNDAPLAVGGIAGIEFFEPLLFFLPVNYDNWRSSSSRYYNQYAISWQRVRDDMLKNPNRWSNLLSTMGSQFSYAMTDSSHRDIEFGGTGLISLATLANISSATNLANLYLTGLIRIPRSWPDLDQMLQKVDKCYELGYCVSRDQTDECSCNLDNLDDYNIAILPPYFRFVYNNVNGTSTLDAQRQGFSQPIHAAPNDRIIENPFYLSSLNPSAIQPKRVSLSIGEVIVRVETICNYRFTFTTNFGRSIVVGDHPLIDHVDACPPSSFYSEFYGSNYPADANVERTVDEAERHFGTNYDPEKLSKYSNDPFKLQTYTMKSWGKPGYSLHYMEGSIGAAYAFRFHWIRQPISYQMTNVQFDISASDLLLTDTQPQYSVAVDLYNESPIQQSVTAIHSITKTKESSFSNTNTEEHHWQAGVSSSLQFTYTKSVGVSGVASTSKSVSFTVAGHYDFGHSRSISTTYGNSVSTSEELQQWFTAEVPPKSKITATLIAFQSKRTIPYKADVEILYASGEKEQMAITGIYKEVTTDSLIVKYSDAQPIENSLTN